MSCNNSKDDDKVNDDDQTGWISVNKKKKTSTPKKNQYNKKYDGMKGKRHGRNNCSSKATCNRKTNSGTKMKKMLRSEQEENCQLKNYTIDVKTRSVDSSKDVKMYKIFWPSLADIDNSKTFPLDNNSIRKALRLWYEDAAEATSIYGPIEKWNTTGVTDMRDLFVGCYDFNEDISEWDVSNVVDMAHLFRSLTMFNQDISSWDVSNVVIMISTFHGTASFNQNINAWDVSSVESMAYMFMEAYSFNQCLDEWDVSNVVNMTSMFYRASVFNQDLSAWNVSNVIYMGGMFYGTTSFNECIGNWNVSNVTTMNNMFDHADSFNQDLSKWNVSRVNDMKQMFYYALEFNQDLSSWDVSGVTDMSLMFFSASKFDQDLSSWNVSNVQKMNSMFKHAFPLQIRLQGCFTGCTSFFDGEFRIMTGNERRQRFEAAFRWGRRKHFLMFLVKNGYLYSKCTSDNYSHLGTMSSIKMRDVTFDISDLSRYICMFL